MTNIVNTETLLIVRKAESINEKQKPKRRRAIQPAQPGAPDVGGRSTSPGVSPPHRALSPLRARTQGQNSTFFLNFFPNMGEISAVTKLDYRLSRHPLDLLFIVI